MKISREDKEGLFGRVLLAYFILILHVLLLAGIVLLVIFLRGVTQYMLWIFLAGAAAIVISGYLFYRRMKTEGRSLREMLQSPMLGGRAVEVSLLGGLASFRFGRPESPPAIDFDAPPEVPRIEDQRSMHVREISELARLYEKNLITLEEYNKAKKQLFKP
jgi:hypothetical protein